MRTLIAHLQSRILKIAQQMPDGFTFDLISCRFPTKGFVVASSATQDCFGSEGLANVIAFCLTHNGYCVGGWKNEYGIMQFDASQVILEGEDAVLSAVENRQRAIFSLDCKKVITSSEYQQYSASLAA